MAEEEWGFVEGLRRTKTSSVCMTCQHFTYLTDRDYRTLLTCGLQKCLVPQGEHLKRSVGTGWSEGRLRLVGAQRLLDERRPPPPIPVKEGDPIFLAVKAGMFVIVQHRPEVGKWHEENSWWMAQVIHVDGGARNPKVPTMFQVADVDDGSIKWVNADLISHIVPRV